MYTEFIIIYCLLALSIVFNVITMITVLKNKSSLTSPRKQNRYDNRYSGGDLPQAAPVVNNYNQQRATTFCRKCGNPFSNDMAVCPKCGTIK